MSYDSDWFSRSVISLSHRELNTMLSLYGVAETTSASILFRLFCYFHICQATRGMIIRRDPPEESFLPSRNTIFYLNCLVQMTVVSPLSLLSSPPSLKLKDCFRWSTFLTWRSLLPHGVWSLRVDSPFRCCRYRRPKYVHRPSCAFSPIQFDHKPWCIRCNYKHFLSINIFRVLLIKDNWKTHFELITHKQRTWKR